MRENAEEHKERVMNRGNSGTRNSVSLTVALLATLLGLPAAAQLNIGEITPTVILDGETGGRVGGGAWSSDSLTGKVHILMYVDPDKVQVNAHVEDALAAQNFDHSKVTSVAVINMAATWKPNFAIDLLLKSKQEKFPNTLYVRDLKRVLAGAWGLVDDGYHVLVIAPDGRVIFSGADALSDLQVEQLIATIHQHAESA